MGEQVFFAEWQDMEQFNEALQRAPESSKSQNGIGMPNGGKSSGWRKPTPGLVVAEQHAQAGERVDIPKTRAVVACKKVGAAIGLKSPDMLLLDTLAAVAQPQDWEQGRRPIVWASNNFLTEQLGWSLSALRRHVRRLCDIGVIAMKDSPNGKRWGRRGDDGYIVEAYGFDLAPLAARAEEFEALHAVLQEERQFCASLRNTITVARRIIRAKIEKAMESRLRGPWRDLEEEFATMLQRLPGRSVSAQKLLDLVDWFTDLKGRVEEAFEAAFDWPQKSDAELVDNVKITQEEVALDSIEMTPTGTVSETHILTTNKPDPVKSNRFETKHAAGVVQDSVPSDNVERLDKQDQDIQWSTHTTRPKSDIDIPTLMQACPEFAEMARSLCGYLKDWNDVHRAAGQLRGVAGISKDAWNVAQNTFGPEVAAAVIALIYDKHATGEVLSPGGYLRGMIEKARAGELHLERSFYGRMSGQAA
ncbi:plasmid replication protein RepC [Ruegeria sp. EL01]|uniref:plasmid replication protein RepC n=1 Tax=Ruegeria sp. EL01 TaxID=2107578 RepID=UPI0020B17892|nr:plasmid replication protein RepC [Ruegeria sp. EL01]